MPRVDVSRYLVLLLPPPAWFGFHLYRSLDRYAARKGGRRVAPRHMIWTLLLAMNLVGAALPNHYGS